MIDDPDQPTAQLAISEVLAELEDENVRLHRELAWEKTVSQQRFERIRYFERLATNLRRDLDVANRSLAALERKLFGRH